MDKILLILFFIIFVVLVMLTIAKIDKKNKLEKENIEDFNNIKEKSTATERIIPDNVHIEKPTTESTQDIDCKKYKIEENEEQVGNIEKITIGNLQEVSKQEISGDASTEPIKEMENPISELFNKEDKI